MSMGKNTREDLLNRIGAFLEMPGVCAPEDRPDILAVCGDFSEEQLTNVAVTLRIRVRSLLRISRSDEKRKAILSTREHLDSFLKKYVLPA